MGENEKDAIYSEFRVIFSIPFISMHFMYIKTNCSLSFHPFKSMH